MTCADLSRTSGGAPPVVSVSLRFSCLQVPRKLHANPFPARNPLDKQHGSSSVSFQWFCPCGAPFPRTGPGGPGSPPSAGSMRALRLPALHPFGLLIHQPAPRCACLFAPGPPQAGAGPDPLLRPVVRVPAIMRRQCGASQVPRRAIPWLCGRSLTPDDPLRLACSGAPGAAPAIIKTKASTLRISRLNSVASPPAVYASRRALPHAMQHSLPAGGLRLYRASVNPAGSRCKGSTHRFLLARAYPGAIQIPVVHC